MSVLLFSTNRDISVGNFWQEDLRTSNYFDSKGFIKTPSAVASGDGNMLKSSSCEGMLGSEFVIIDDFKISAGGGKSELIISSIYR
ncbi:hypothetical protein BSPWISOXPB_9244 [uncultured Gammaproteobacteria bacterium]|nr:hypothetical protein BSPWISOXPB_9244 [uncultured Gammaproteobacteria bacterium]